MFDKVINFLILFVIISTISACSNIYDDFDPQEELSISYNDKQENTPYVLESQSEIAADCQMEANQLNREIIEGLCPCVRSLVDSSNTMREYPNFWGGSFITPTGKLTILFIGDSLTCVKGISAISNSKTIIFKRGMHTYNELLHVMSVIDSCATYAPISIRNNICGYGILDDENIVEISLIKKNNKFINDFKAIYNHPAIRFVESGELIEESTPLNPGGYLTCSSTGAHGSYSFRAMEKNGLKRVGMVTAGHVLSVGDSVFINGEAIAECTVSNNSGSVDAAFVPIDTTEYKPSNYIVGTLNELSTATSLPGVGTFVNMRGAETGSGGQGGYIKSTNYTYTSNGIKFTNMTTATYSSQSGDSGGIIYTYVKSTDTRYTVGIHKGTTATSGVKAFTKASLALQSLNVIRY